MRIPDSRFTGVYLGFVLSFVLAAGIPAASLPALQTEEDTEFKPPVKIRPYIGLVAGSVVDSSGKPLSDATVVYSSGYRVREKQTSFDNYTIRQAARVPKSRWFKTTTDDKGNFRFRAPLRIDTNTSVTVLHPDFACVPDYDLHDGMKLQGRAGAVVRGKVVDSKGNPLPGVEVSLDDLPFTEQSLGFEHSMAETDANGQFEIPHVDDKRQHSLIIERDGFVVERLYWLPQSFKEPESNLPQAATHMKYVRNDFVFKLPSTATVRIIATDPRSDKLVELEWVRSSPILGNRLPTSPGGTVAKNKGRVAQSTVSTKYGTNHRFWVKPKESSGLLGTFLEVKVKGSDVVEKKVKLEQGRTIRGRVVDDETGVPIKNVAIGYYPKNPDALEKSNIFSPVFVRTDDNGEFIMSVHVAPAELKMIGEVPGYRTLSHSHPDVLPAKIYAQFVRAIDPVSVAKIPDINFRLKRAIQISGSLYDDENRPAADVPFIATHFRFRDPQSSSSAARSETIVGKTDAKGKFTLDSLFDDVLFQYDELSERDKERLARGGRVIGGREPRVRTNQVFFWDLDNNLACTRSITLDEAIDNPSKIDARLGPAPTIKGRIVDSKTGEGIGGFKFSSDLRNPPGFRRATWQTETNSQGYFYLPCLMANSQLDPRFWLTGYRVRVNPFVIGDGDELIVLDDIQAVKPEPEKAIVVGNVVDVSKLPDDEALKKLVDFVKAELKKLPPRDAGGGWSSGSPRNKFKFKLTNAITEQARELAKRKPDSDFQCRVYIDLLKPFGDGAPPMRMEPLPFTDLSLEARYVLIENIDRDGVFEFYRQVEWGFSGTMWASKILENSKKKEVRGWSIYKLASSYGFELANACKSKSTSAASFEEKLKQTSETWKLALGELADVAVGGSTVKKRVLEHIPRIEAKVQRDERYDKDRVKKVLELINQLKPGPKT